ncbi:monosaccharide ABC transporter substrate-binding protein, CUT2 family [Pseudooceanicola antarcticus]|uniref:Monosaccharide ABC transporter substrate-binding protein, CUT2 family n=1 Tax=Pseudooceanicola antarcticus TaxID=1247613 RepID=A0A285JE83_9RHOB|nr:sugar ABC transporter substrate-binding protein [Pseudooceanicola antarcticus]PJE31091.1 ribose ABC transporter substrate-binding protein [Pseudooceanicola antarcticus]SNY58589.1 monosaccharide ABC transporter substrate-binding protein, CUT2 family [Pseudooceanicola antarcticus]
MKTKSLFATLVTATFLSGGAAFAGPEVVSGPGALPECFAPWDEDTSFLQWSAKEGPYKIAVVNGFVGNTWRIQMVKTAKAFAEDPTIKDKISEFKVVSTGTDAPAQLGAIEDFINQGYDAIITIAVAPTGFDRVIRLADKNDVVLVPFDNVLDTDKVMQVNEDQLAMGKKWGEFILGELHEMGIDSGKLLEVRGLAGNSVDRDRSLAINEAIAADGGDWEVVSVVGNWDDGTTQKVVADAIAVHGQFDAVIGQGGSNGIVQALQDSGHPWVPVAGESENGFRKAIAEHSADGLKGISIGQSPGLVAVAMKAAVSALEGNVMPQLISVPLPVATYKGLEDGKNYWSELPDNFFTVNEFPPCDVNISGPAIMAESEEDMK